MGAPAAKAVRSGGGPAFLVTSDFIAFSPSPNGMTDIWYHLSGLSKASEQTPRTPPPSSRSAALSAPSGLCSQQGERLPEPLRCLLHCPLGEGELDLHVPISLLEKSRPAADFFPPGRALPPGLLPWRGTAGSQGAPIVILRDLPRRPSARLGSALSVHGQMFSLAELPRDVAVCLIKTWRGSVQRSLLASFPPGRRGRPAGSPSPPPGKQVPQARPGSLVLPCSALDSRRKLGSF